MGLGKETARHIKDNGFEVYSCKILKEFGSKRHSRFALIEKQAEAPSLSREGMNAVPTPIELEAKSISS